jgi:hypothetical protein
MNDHGYKIHLIYGALAAPTEKAYSTVNETPEAVTFSWELTTTPIAVPGLKPTALIVIDSTKVDATALADLEDMLYGTEGADARLPLPAEIITLFSGTVTEVETETPTYDDTTDFITIPTVTGVDYYVAGVLVPSGDFGPISEDTVVTALPQAGYVFSDTSDNSWTIYFA